MQLFLHPGESIPPNSNLIVSVPSEAGNTGLMTMDSLLSTLPSIRIGSIESRCLLSISGYEQYKPHEPPVLCMPMEVYRILDTNLIMIHQRSICALGKTKAFFEEYKEFLDSLQANFILFLTSESVNVMPDAFVHGPRIFSYYTTPSPNVEFAKLIEVCHGICYESDSSESWEDIEDEAVYHQDTYSSFLFIKHSLMNTASTTLIFGCFSPENGRVVDSNNMTSFLLKTLPIAVPTGIRIATPKSWEILITGIERPVAEHSLVDYMY
jgi:hypothetical protein